VSGETLILPAPPAAAAQSDRVELVFRNDHSADKLSACELEALSPVLPELVGELLAVMSLEHE
jgi:hypothetical protein